MPFLFKKLEVYNKAISISVEISALTEGFPKGTYYLADQINRAVLSIATNIAEGNGRFQKPDRIHFFRIARGSAFECIPIIEICKRRNLIIEKTCANLEERLDEIGKMLTGLIQYK